MAHFQFNTFELILLCVAGVILLFIGYRLGRLVGGLAAGRLLAQKEQDVFLPPSAASRPSMSRN